MAETIDRRYALEDCFTHPSGCFYLTGTQALVLLPMLQARSDRDAGLDTAGFVSGYRGSPLGGLDQALWRAQPHLEKLRIRFVPGLNEELAATAVAGSQQVEAEGKAARHDGVFGLFYAKGPGIDRAGDALKHGHANGASPRGGVLVVAGDDHGCVSSSMSHQSDLAMQAWHMPVLNPADLREYLEFGLYGWALSRYSGAWVGFKAISETVESAGIVTLPDPLPRFDRPVDFVPPPDGLHYRWPNLPSAEIERRMLARLDAVRAFAAANSIDRMLSAPATASLGIVTCGKAHLDLTQALEDLGLDPGALEALGIRLYKVGLAFPLEPRRMLRFAEGLEEILVVEEKGPVVEQQLKTLLFDRRLVDVRVLGKRDHEGRPLIPEVEETRPHRLRRVLRDWLARTRPGLVLREEPSELALAEPEAAAERRVPYFCPGCPHNTSTRVPEGSRAYGGIGCHYMAAWMDRNTQGLIQMGGEGVNWIGLAPFTRTEHVFQNLGDGTYSHSGSLAIRAALAAGVNITYKILVNDAVAMTGGQPVEGNPSVATICRELDAEGVKVIRLVADDIEPLRRASLPASVRLHPREELDTVQEALKRTPGVSVLLYVQTCAAEKRRRRRRGRLPEPARRLVIHEQVCEGCGDCSRASNCIAVTPVDTAWGRKRHIDQTACNLDYRCNEGFCPSFISLEGARPRPVVEVDDAELAEALARLPEPEAGIGEGVYNLLVTGVGGTGVVTVGAILCVAARLEGRWATVLDFMGFAQKGGAVISHVRLADDPARLHQVRIDRARADALIACDLVVANQPEPLAALKHGTRVVASVDLMPTAAQVLDPDKKLDGAGLLARIRQRVGGAKVHADAFRAWSERFTGSTTGANILQLGYAWQSGLVPLGRAAIERAIELNGVAVADNLRLFALGRLLAGEPKLVARWGDDETVEAEDAAGSEGLAQTVERFAAYLADYQDAAYAESYRSFLSEVAHSAERLGKAGEAFTRAVARGLFRLMAYKDEYEVARLLADPRFHASLRRRFGGDYRLAFHLAPPLLARRDPVTGRPRKRRFGPWLIPLLRSLVSLRRLRGTPFDPFGYSAERRRERELIDHYRETVRALLPRLEVANLDLAVEIACLADQVRGYGPVKAEAMERYFENERRLLERYAGVVGWEEAA
ncbi:MAG: indolepyruvate ferredoxin oxidoreductase family protein [Gammaproteobacteria bacterium]